MSQIKLKLRQGSTDIAVVVASGYSATETYKLTLTRLLVSTTTTLTGYIQRGADNFYLKPDGTWQAGSVAFSTSSIDNVNDAQGVRPHFSAGVVGATLAGLSLDNVMMD